MLLRSAFLQSSDSLGIKAFYGCAGIGKPLYLDASLSRIDVFPTLLIWIIFLGLWIASIMEWVIGNTFPCVVFGTFGKLDFNVK